MFCAGVGLFAVVGILDLGTQYGPSRAISLGVPAVCLVVGALTLERSGSWLRVPGLRMLGDVSYSLYLVHGIVGGFVGKFFHLTSAVSPVIMLSLSIATAAISYRLFEVPVGRALHSLPVLQ